jgi:DsbC/DsbD-like thiol-disulfide interchange protein
MKSPFGWILGGLALALAASSPAGAQTVASPWLDHDGRAQTRLVAAQHEGRLVAFVEILMPEGWKTYWRNPGDAGGLPPTFDFAKSTNLASARVLYPAPKRLADRAGETIGYKGRALFPVEIAPAAAGKPVTLNLAAHFGVCREICVPLDASHTLTAETGIVGPAEGVLLDALNSVPRPVADAKDGDPKVVRAEVDSYEPPAQITIVATFPGGAQGADLFIEAPDGLYVPMPKRLADPAADGAVAFQSTFGSAAELKQILGKPLKVTLVGASGQTESVVTIE